MIEPPRGDRRMIEDAGVAFAMYCDTHGLTIEEGRELAAELANEVESVAEDRTYAEAGER